MKINVQVKYEEVKRSIYEFLVKSGVPGLELIEDKSLNEMMRDFVTIDKNLSYLDKEEEKIVYMKDIICRLLATVHIQQKLLDEKLGEEE